VVQVLGEKGTRRRDDILVAARRVLVDNGYDQFSMREIAASVGMKLGNLQYYFRSREDLLEALIRVEFEENLGMLERFASADGEPIGSLKSATRALVKVWMREGASVYAVMSFLALHHDRFRDLHREIYDRFYEVIGAFLHNIDVDMPKALRRRKARLITSLLDGALLQFQENYSGQRLGAQDQFLDDISDVVRLIAKG